MAKKRVTRFGDRLRELRTQAGMTQADLSARAGMHVYGLAKLERGDREPAWATVLDLAKALGVSCEAFTQEPAEREPAGPGRPRNAEEEPAEGKPGKAAGKPATGRTAGQAGQGSGSKKKARKGKE